MKRTVNLFVVLGVFGLVLSMFFVLNNRLCNQIDSANAELELVQEELSSAMARQTELENTVKQASTDAYIENIARTVYGYMSKDEVLFVITNPEDLYEDGVVPER